MHVNVGGATRERVQEIALWAELHSVDIVILSETRWSFVSEWTQGNWMHLHSGTASDRADGILIMVHRRVCHADRLGYAEVLQGRIVHLRIHFTNRNFDLISCYQYADTRTSHRDQQRKQFWAQLQAHASNLPNRNAVMYAGDFNCSLPPDGFHAGTNQFTLQGITRQGPLHRDSVTFQQFLRTQQLVSAGAWNAQDPPTFVNGVHGSKIDHFLLRHADSDFHSKQIVYYPNAEFLPLNGARHIPMICSVRKIPFVFTKAAAMQSCSFFQRLSCRNAWKEQGQQWQAFCEASENRLTQFQQTYHPADTVIDDLHSSLMPCFQQFFPKMHPPSNRTTIHRDEMLTVWDLKRKLQKARLCTMPAIFQLWQNWTRYVWLRRNQKTRTKQMKKQQLQDLLADAQSAAARHDGFGLYQLINKYSPKQPRRRIRLRTPTGQPASAAESLNMMQQFVRDQWQGPDAVDYDRTVPCEVPFSLQELTEELSRIPAVKAVAKPFLPGLYWKQFAEPVAACSTTC